MLNLSPQVGELLLKVTRSQDLDEALHKVLKDYLDLKLSSLSTAIARFEEKWGCPFEEFKEKTQGEYSYEVENEFWEWERLETLKAHYQVLQKQWK